MNLSHSASADIYTGKSAVIYARRSTGSSRQKESSLKDQVSICQKLANELGLSLPYDNYAEQHKGGGIRPQFQKLKNDILTGKISPDYILVEKLDRLSRQLWEEYAKDVEPLDQAGKFLIVGTGKYSGEAKRFVPISQDVGEYIAALIDQSSNAEFSASLADRIAHRANEKALQGKLFGRNIFGWDRIKQRDANDNVTSVEIVPNDDAAIVQELFKHYAINGNLLDLRPILKKSKHYPKKRCKSCANKFRANGDKLHGLSVSNSVDRCSREYEDTNTFENEICGCVEFEEIDIKGADIRSILRNPYHVGDYSYFKTNTGKYRQRVGGKVVNIKREEANNIKRKQRQNINPENAEVYIRNHHEGIIDRQTFDKVQERLDNNKKDTSNRGRKRSGLLTGILKCGCCGGNLSYRSTQGKPKYSCDFANKGSEAICTGGAKSITEERATDILINMAYDELCKPLFWKNKIKEVVELVKQRELFLAQSNPQDDEEDITKKIEKLELQAKSLDLSDAVNISILRKIEEQKVQEVAKLEELNVARGKFSDDPIYELLDQLSVDYSSILNVNLPPIDCEIVEINQGFKMDDDGNIVIMEINQIPFDHITDIRKTRLLIDHEVGAFKIQQLKDYYPIFAELANGSHLHQLVLGYLIYNRYQESSPRALEVVSVAIAESFARLVEDTSDINWLGMIKSCNLNFVLNDDYKFNNDTAVAQSTYSARNKHFVRDYTIELDDSSVGKRYHRSRSYCFRIRNTK